MTSSTSSSSSLSSSPSTRTAIRVLPAGTLTETRYPFSVRFRSSAFRTFHSMLKNDKLDETTKALKLDESLPFMWDEEMFSLSCILKEEHPEVARRWIEVRAKKPNDGNRAYLMACWARFYLG